MSRVVAAFAVLLGAVLGGLTQLGTLGAAQSAAGGAVAVHMYDNPGVSGEPRDAMVERGPLLAYSINSDTGVRHPLGNSTRLVATCGQNNSSHLTRINTCGTRRGKVTGPRHGLGPHSRVAAKGVSSSGIRFSQSSVNGAAEIEASMRANGWVGDAIDVVRMNDGGLTSLDSTRLLAAKRAGIDVQANIHGFDDALPAGMIERFTTAKGGVPSTWGDAVMNRTGGQGAGYGGANPFGSWVTGWSGN